MLDESKFQLFLGQEENSEAALQERAPGNGFCRTKKHRHQKAAQAWHEQYSAAPFPTAEVILQGKYKHVWGFISY